MTTTPPDRSPAAKLRIFTVIRQIHAEYPDLRVGQIVYSALGGADLFYLEDEKLLELLVAHRDWLATHRDAEPLCDCGHPIRRHWSREGCTNDQCSCSKDYGARRGTAATPPATRGQKGTDSTPQK